MSNLQDCKKKSDVLVEFLEVAFHSILYYRNVYPKSIFCLKKKYNVPIHVSVHAEVNNYVSKCLKTVQKLLKENAVKQIALVIVNNKNVSMEKYCFDIENSKNTDDDPYFVRTEEVFREYLLKLSVADFKELTNECTFQIQLTTSEQSSVKLSENISQVGFPWMEAETKNETERHLKIFPVKTLETSLLTLNMYIEK